MKRRVPKTTSVKKVDATLAGITVAGWTGVYGRDNIKGKWVKCGVQGRACQNEQISLRVDNVSYFLLFCYSPLFYPALVLGVLP